MTSNSVDSGRSQTSERTVEPPAYITADFGITQATENSSRPAVSRYNAAGITHRSVPLPAPPRILRRLPRNQRPVEPPWRIEGPFTPPPTPIGPLQDRSDPDLPAVNRTLPIARTLAKRRRRGRRGTNSLAVRSAHRNTCPPRTPKQADHLRYHRRILDRFKEIHRIGAANFERGDLYCRVCDKGTTGLQQLKNHFSSKQHKVAVFRCTPKYCVPCGITVSFGTPQLWDAHLRSRRHQSKARGKSSSQYGFI